VRQTTFDAESSNRVGQRKVSDVAAPAAQWLQEQREALSTRGERLMDSASKYVAAHPLQSLGLALAAGYLASLLTRSSSKRQP
jgi:ElaB/YqjD/DUF883 family membrane-anchored ribosome-binding protein